MEDPDHLTVDKATIACDRLIETECYHVNTPVACSETARMIFFTMTDTNFAASEMARRALFDMISMAKCGGELGCPSEVVLWFFKSWHQKPEKRNQTKNVSAPISSPLLVTIAHLICHCDRGPRICAVQLRGIG
jgi:hypothetical protein